MHSSCMLRESAMPEVVRDNMVTSNIDVTQNRQQPNLNHHLVHLFLDELHWQDMVNGLTIMPKSEN
jgi:hypothetical protein